MISLLSGLLGVRLAAAHDSFRRMSILHFLALLLLTMSLLFVVTSAILILGKGAHLRRSACEGAIWLCISLYALSKLVLYLLLLEKVWAVHGLASLGHRNRWDSKWYRVGAVLVLGWVAVAILEIALHDDPTPRRRDGRQSLPHSGFLITNLAEQVASDSETGSALEYRRPDLFSNLLQQRLHHHHSRRQRVELDLPRELLDRHLDQCPRGLCSHDLSGGDLSEYWSALSRRTGKMARALAEEADRKTRPLLD
ncbi:hypothetical protein C6P46_006787 [Rhodotorula mucilaginosa]|uniref:Uncharacterized protein n=1 Tax=Rhodotorula mucilaginosa TaxID=5537 RepID=A0A9P6W5L4_RHOMI|nr:hypothetical protein C6P46_006787 [Rhodotorula mucilaginosa]